MFGFFLNIILASLMSMHRRLPGDPGLGTGLLFIPGGLLLHAGNNILRRGHKITTPQLCGCCAQPQNGKTPKKTPNDAGRRTL